uniref:Putative ATPase n=1 Tax=Acidipropionibacterium jensenii TaxID=1749 RepID=C7SQN7_9ACTN|nr:putative ATPase [Acidipropionibacterium jensenii]
MRLHRIHVENFRSIHERTLTLPDCGLVIAEGLNEVGKTSMIEALDLLLDPKLKATSKAGRVIQTQPYGTDLPVVVEAEMTVGGVRLIHSKQFLHQPQARLEFVSGRRAGEVLTGEEATDAMAEIWRGTDDTLWQALRLMQAGSLEALSLRSSTALTAALDRAVHDQGGEGDDVAAPDGASENGADRDGAGLLAAVTHEYEQYWTPTGKPGKVLKEAASEAEKLTAELQQAAARLADVDTVVSDLEESQENLEDQQKSLAALKVSAARDAAALADLEDLEHAVTEATRAEQDARHLRDAAVDELKDRRAAVAELAGARDAEEDARAAARTAHEAVEAVESQFAEADQAWREADSARRKAKDAWDAARRRASELRDQARLERLNQTITTITALQTEIAEAENRVDANPATAAGIKAARAAEQKLTAARIRLETASPRMTLTRLAEDAPELRVDGEPISDEGEPIGGEGDDESRVVDRRTVVEIAEAWRITVVPAADVDDLAHQVEAAERDLAALLDPMGVATVEEARDLLSRRRREEDALTALHQRVARELEDAGAEAERSGGTGSGAGSVSLADLIAVRDRITASSALVHERATTGSSTADTETDTAPGMTDGSEALQGADRSTETPEQADQWADLLESAHEDADLAETTARSARDTVQERRSTAREAASAASSTLTSSHDQVQRLQDRLETAREQTSDQALEDAARAAEEQHKDAANRVTEASQDLESHSPDQVREAAQASARRLARAGERLAASRGRHAELTGQLRGLDREGRQDRFDELSGLAHRSGIESAALTRRADAAQLLHDTLIRHRDEEHRRYLEPFTREVERLGRGVFGRDMAVRVDDSLTVTKRLLNGAWLDWDQLSTGAKEQLGLVVRLATAQLVDPKDGVPVILDDALVYSDRVRTSRVLKEVATGSRNHQVIVLTSAPERYDGLDATRIPFQ